MVSALELVVAKEVGAALRGSDGVSVGVGPGAAGLEVAVGQLWCLRGLNLGEAERQDGVVAAFGVGGHRATVGEDAVPGLVAAGEGRGHDAAGEEGGSEEMHLGLGLWVRGYFDISARRVGI